MNVRKCDLLLAIFLNYNLINEQEREVIRIG